MQGQNYYEAYNQNGYSNQGYSGQQRGLSQQHVANVNNNGYGNYSQDMNMVGQQNNNDYRNQYQQGQSYPYNGQMNEQFGYRQQPIQNSNGYNGYNGYNQPVKKKNILIPIIAVLAVIILIAIGAIFLLKGIMDKGLDRGNSKIDTTVISPDIIDIEEAEIEELEYVPIDGAVKNETSLLGNNKELIAIPIFENTALINGHEISILMPTSYTVDIEYSYINDENIAEFASTRDQYTDAIDTLAELIDSGMYNIGLGAEHISASNPVNYKQDFYVLIQYVNYDNTEINKEEWCKSEIDNYKEKMITGNPIVTDGIVDTKYGKAAYVTEESVEDGDKEVTLYLPVGNTSIKMSYVDPSMNLENIEEIIEEMVGLVQLNDLSEPKYDNNSLVSLNGYNLTNQILFNVEEPIDKYEAYIKSSFESWSLSPATMHAKLPGNYIVSIETDEDVELYTVKEAFELGKLDSVNGQEEITIYSDIYKDEQEFEIVAELPESDDYIKSVYIDDEDDRYTQLDVDGHMLFYSTYQNDAGEIDSMCIKYFTNKGTAIDFGTGDNRDCVEINCYGLMNARLIKILGPDEFARSVVSMIVDRDRF